LTKVQITPKLIIGILSYVAFEGAVTLIIK